MTHLYVLLLSIIFNLFVHASDNTVTHKLDETALQELYLATRQEPMKYPMPMGTDNRAQYEYWQLAIRISTRNTFEDIFTANEKKHFNDLTNEIFASDSYKIQYQKFQADPKQVAQYKKVAAILAKNKLVERGVKYQENPSYNTFKQFIEINHDISGETIDWMIAGTMFLYYLRQIERQQCGHGF